MTSFDPTTRRARFDLVLRGGLDAGRLDLLLPAVA